MCSRALAREPGRPPAGQEHLPPAGASRLRDVGSDSAGLLVSGRGASSRLPLSPVRTYQEPPEGPRSFVQWGAPFWPSGVS